MIESHTGPLPLHRLNVSPKPFHWLVLRAWLAILAAIPAFGGITISEFLATNDGALQDEDLESPGWIELFNNGATSVNLAGWHLTDDTGNLTKWTLPATNLPAGGYLVVFASGKNRGAPGWPLHTNFQLGNGGYLALVRPDGLTVEQAYADYPKQRANVSYGVATDYPITPLLTSGASVRVLVPTSGGLGLTWTARDFNDSAWATSNAPVGFAVGVTNVPLLALDMNRRGANAAQTTAAGFSSFVINSNGSSSTIQTQATTRVFGAITVTITNLAPYGYDDRLRATPTDSGAFTDGALLQDFVFSRDDSGSGGLDVSLSGLASNQVYDLTIWSFDSGSPGNRVSDWFANGVPVITNYTFNGSTLPTANEQYRFRFNVTADANGKIVLSGRRDAATGPTFGVFLNALKLETVSALPGPTNGLAALMVGSNATAYLRFPFTVTDPNAFTNLRLRMKYDDGFLAYVNGQLVAARNAPASPQWNSTATAARSDADNLAYEDIVFTNAPGLLANGTNVLAIQGLNVSRTDPDFSIQPLLDGLGAATLAARYFTPATPGAANGSGYLGLVADTKFSVDRGFYEVPFTVAITSATAGASIYFTTNGSLPSLLNGTLYTSPIPVAGNSLLRAAAFLDGYVSSIPDAQTYLFLSQVLQQPANPPGYPMVWQAGYPADYGMDPNVVNSPKYGGTISNDLRSIPTLSLVSDFDSFWNAATGMYVDATVEVERPGSAELFDGDNTSRFQINCILRMEGNASRDNNRLGKHSFRLKFSSDAGPSHLNYAWFPGAISTFDNIVLRACFTDAWPTRYSDLTVIPGGMGTRYRPEEALYLRDVWVKESMRDMGQLAGRGDFVHLYVNGLYWGLYNPTERLDSSYFARQRGGYQKDWDVMRDFNELLDGTRADWDQLMALVNAGIGSEAQYQAVTQQVDLVNLIDYMLLHIHAEAEDWPAHNWYGAHRHANPTNGLPATPWIFLPWDQEITMDQLVTRNRVDASDNNSPARIYSQLRNWPEFRREFGDRVQKHLFNGGALVPSNSIARMQGLAARINSAIVGESARWGDAREFTIGANPGTGITFTRDEWWVPELQKLYTNYLPNINAVTLSRLQAAGLYPTIDAPRFSQFGGAVTNGFGLVLSHTNTTGTILFTTDGTDPRSYGTGTAAPGAQVFTTPILFNGPTQVRARVLSTGQWSALVEATFYPPQDLSRLSLTEIMYHPPNLGGIDGNNLEFLELKNYGTNTLDLSGLTFTAGIDFAFTNGTKLAPGEFFVLARNATAFAMKYPSVTVNGVYAGQLNNSGETLTLSHPLGATIFSVNFGDRQPWPLAPDVADFSLVPRQPGQSQAPDQGLRWRASANPGGSPGADDPEPTVPPILIDELMTHTDPPLKDTIELFNPTTNTVDLGGWFLSDDASLPTKYRIPDHTLIPAGGRILFTEDNFNPTPGVGNSFAFNSTGDEIHLFSASTNGGFTGYDHSVAFGALFNGGTFGRYVNSAGAEFFPVQLAPTLGSTNSGPRIGPVVISEIHYHPDPGGDEFVELLNLTSNAVPLYDPLHPTNAWRLNGLGFTFPTNTMLAGNSTLLLVATNPAAFRAHYNVPTGVPILGPYPGHLQNGGENLELEFPDNPNPDGVVPYVVADAVQYNNKSPWPVGADGGGLSLQRVPASGYGNEPLNWIAAAPTPGALSGSGDSDGDGLPDVWEQEHGTFVFIPDANDDPDGDGLSNLQEYQSGTDPHDAASVLKLEAAQLDAGSGTLLLNFLALASRSYSVLQKQSLDDSAWTKLTDVPAVATNRVVGIPQPFPGSAGFFRLVTPSLP